MATTLRCARSLLGWMTLEQVRAAGTSHQADRQLDPVFEALAANARAAVARRPVGVDQAELARDTPAELGDYIHQMQQNPMSAQYFNEGWRVQLVDLRRLCAIQPSVHTEAAADRVAGLDAADILSIANVTMPVPPAGVNLPLQFDQTRNTFLLTSSNPNLRVLGPFAGPVEGQPGLVVGFSIMLLPSFLLVVRHHQRYFLRDGYHRAYGLLQRGIFAVPAFTREFAPHEDPRLANPGLFAAGVFLGEQPPTLADYADDSVAASTQLPASEKLIVVSGLETNITIRAANPS